MSRETIDYGIDLGTTNSAISLASGTVTEVIKNNVDGDITPSAVYINRSGSLWVGQSAKSKMADERSEEDVFLEFKRRMGTGFEYTFRSSGRKMKPEDLSAEVLKSLRGDVSQKKGEDITAAVITVPAAFELHQCDATKRAAQLAGFKTALLLQEPVAAAMAYGYQRMDAKAYWLIFDFGGGTFDAALIRSEEGNMVVANHGGDNFLGGSDIDWAILEKVVIPRITAEYKVKGFERGSDRFKHDLLRLKSAIESAKIELSRKESTFLETALSKVGPQSVMFETELTRKDVAAAAEPIITKAVAIAKRVLSEKGISPSAVEKLVFVGGPTLAPYFRDLVQERLGIPFDIGVDPLTVVARGAAIFAGSQRIAAKPAAVAKVVDPAAKFTVDLVYKPVGPDSEPLIGGKVSSPLGIKIPGCTIEIINQRTKWRGGKVALAANGAFQVPVRAEKGAQNLFSIELRDATGTIHSISPSQFGYTVGVVVEEQPIINNMGVATADNKMAVHFTKGQGLPAKFTKTYRTSTALKKGESGSVVKIPIIEGNRDQADRNLLIGTLEISSDKIKRDLPAGSEMEVTLHMDTSRILQVVAYVPLLDEEFPSRIELGGKLRQPDPALMRTEFTQEKQRLMALKTGLDSVRDKSAISATTALETSPSLQTLDQTLSRETADFDALLKAERELLDLKVRLDEISSLVTWPALQKDAEVRLAELDGLVSQHGTTEEKTRAKTLRDQIRAVLSEKNSDRLRRKLEEIAEAHTAILYRQPSFWIEHFGALAACQSLMSQPEKAAQLLREGRIHADTANLVELKNVIFQLQDLLPKNVVEEARRGYGSHLVA